MLVSRASAKTVSTAPVDTNRKFYSREFILKIRELMTAPVRPKLPNMEICLAAPNYQNGKSRHPPPPRNPPSTSHNPRQLFGKQTQQNWNQPSDIKDFGTIVSNHVHLHRSDNAWKGSNKNRVTRAGDETQLLLKKMNAILNKLAPDNFEKIISQVQGIGIVSAEKLEGCISLIFEKAVLEPTYSPTYAKMALRLADISVKMDDKKVANFRLLLLRKCQMEFEKDKSEEASFSDLTEKISKAKDESEKKRLSAEKELAIFKAKKRSLGNIKFIGELFKLNMLSEAVMFQCFSKLMKGSDEESLECLCKLLTTIGITLDVKSKVNVDMLIRDLKKIAEKKVTSSRIRFMIMDVVDLRKAKWVPKRNEGPKTIAQVHEEASKEKSCQASRVHEAQRGPKQRDSPRNAQDRDLEKKKDAAVTIDRRENRNPRLNANDDNSWRSRGRVVDQSKRNEVQRGPPINKQCNRSETVVNGKPKIQSDKPSKPARDVHKMEDAKNIKQQVTISNALPRKEMELKTKSRIEEYLNVNDIREALDTIKELKTDVCYPNGVRFFYISMLQNVERSRKDRQAIGELHMHMLNNSIAPLKAYSDALIKFSRYASELVVDIPQVWSYFEDFITPVVAGSRSFKLNAFAENDAADSELDDDMFEEDDSKAKVLAAVLNGLSKAKGKDKALKAWTESRLKWENLVKNAKVDEFKRKYFKF